jgi:hypothetical protein
VTFIALAEPFNGRTLSAVEIEFVIISLSVIGFLFVLGALIRQLHLKEIKITMKFNDDNEPPKQIKK